MKRTRLLLLLDTILFLALAVLIEPRSSLTVHEWLGLAIVPLVVIHILFAWQWILMTLRRLSAKGAWRLRINTLLNMLLFVAFVVAAFSGVMTSFIAMPALGIPPGNFEGWRRLHNDWSLYLQILAGLHIAVNWNWIVGAIRRHILARPTAKSEAAIGTLAERNEV